MIGRENSTGPFCQIAAIPPPLSDHQSSAAAPDLGSQFTPPPPSNVAPDGPVSLPSTMALDSNSAIYARWRNSTLIACSPKAHITVAQNSRYGDTTHPQMFDKTGPAVPVSPPPPSEAREAGRGGALGDPGPGMAFREGGSRTYLGAVRRAVDSISPTYTSTPEERNRCVETWSGLLSRAST